MRVECHASTRVDQAIVDNVASTAWRTTSPFVPVIALSLVSATSGLGVIRPYAAHFDHA